MCVVVYPHPRKFSAHRYHSEGGTTVFDISAAFLIHVYDVPYAYM